MWYLHLSADWALAKLESWDSLLRGLSSITISPALFFLTLPLFHSLLPAPISAECGADSVRWIKKGIKIVAVVKIVSTAKYLQGKVVRAIVRGILVTVVDGAFVDVGASVVVSPSVVAGMLLHKLVLQQNWSHDWMFPVVLRGSHPGLSSQLRPVMLKHPLVTVVLPVSRLNASSVVQTSSVLHCTVRSLRVQFLSVSPWHSAHVRFFIWEFRFTVKKIHTLSIFLLHVCDILEDSRYVKDYFCHNK